MSTGDVDDNYWGEAMSTGDVDDNYWGEAMSTGSSLLMCQGSLLPPSSCNVIFMDYHED